MSDEPRCDFHWHDAELAGLRSELERERDGRDEAVSKLGTLRSQLSDTETARDKWRDRFQEVSKRFDEETNLRVQQRMQLSDTERRLGEAVASRAELAQDIEDLLLVATTDEDAEGFVTAYHFKTGALHRLLGKARQAMPAEWSVDSHLGAHPDNIPTPEGRLISATPKDRP